MTIERDRAEQGNTFSPLLFLTRSAWREPAAAHRLMLVIVALMVVASALWGERVQAGGGLGWDGQTYGNIVRNFDTMLDRGMLGIYYSQRILPALVVRALLQLIGAPLDNHAIILAFVFLNGTIVLLLAEVWRRIANHLALGMQGRWLGFSALFVNFELSKQNLYYPVLTDVTTLFLAALLMLFYLRRAPVAMLCVTLVGAFCWPAFALTGALLIGLLPTKPAAAISDISAADPGRVSSIWRSTIWVGIIIVALCAIAQLPVAYSACASSGLVERLFAPLLGQAANLHAQIDSPNALPASCVLIQRVTTAIPSVSLVALATIVMGMPLLLATLKRPRFHIAARRLMLILLAGAALAIPWLVIRLVANPAVPNPNNMLLMAKIILLPAAGKIFLPVLSAIVFWGPTLLLLILSWRRAARQARALGLGVVLAICLTLGLGLAGEPRFLTAGWPLLVIVGVLAFERLGLPRAFYIAFAVCSLLLAQFWLPLNLVPWTGGDGENLANFPKQLYFMHYGLWMAWPGYVGQLLVVLAMGGWLSHELRSATSVRAQTGRAWTEREDFGE